MLFVLALIAVSVYAAISIKNSTKNLSDENFEYEIIDSKNLEIKKGIYYIDESINYKDLKEDKEFQAVTNKEEINHG